MNDPTKFDWSDPKAVYGTMLAMFTAVFGGGYFVRDDAFTGSEGEVLEAHIGKVEHRVDLMYERGPIEIRQGIKEIKIILSEIKLQMRDEKTRDGTDGKQADRIEAKLQQMQKEQRDHFRARHQ